LQKQPGMSRGPKQSGTSETQNASSSRGTLTNSQEASRKEKSLLTPEKNLKPLKCRKEKKTAGEGLAGDWIQGPKRRNLKRCTKRKVTQGDYSYKYLYQLTGVAGSVTYSRENQRWKNFLYRSVKLILTRYRVKLGKDLKWVLSGEGGTKRGRFYLVSEKGGGGN